MTAGGENDKSTSLQVKGGGEFMLELVGNNRVGLLFLRQLARKAANPVLETNLHTAWREHLLKTTQVNLSCREGMLRHERWFLSVGHRQVGMLQCSAIKNAEIARNRWTTPFARAKALLSANVKRPLGFQLAAVGP